MQTVRMYSEAEFKQLCRNACANPVIPNNMTSSTVDDKPTVEDYLYTIWYHLCLSVSLTRCFLPSYVKTSLLLGQQIQDLIKDKKSEDFDELSVMGGCINDAFNK